MGTRELAALDLRAELAEGPAARKGPVALDRRQREQRRAHVRHAGVPFAMLARHRREPAQIIDQADPAVGADFPDTAMTAQRGGAAVPNRSFIHRSSPLSRRSGFFVVGTGRAGSLRLRQSSQGVQVGVRAAVPAIYVELAFAIAKTLQRL